MNEQIVITRKIWIALLFMFTPNQLQIRKLPPKQQQIVVPLGLFSTLTLLSVFVNKRHLTTLADHPTSVAPVSESEPNDTLTHPLRLPFRCHKWDGSNK